MTIQVVSAEELNKRCPERFNMRKYLLERGESHIYGKDGYVWREDPDGTITRLSKYGETEARLKAEGKL